MQQLAIHTEGGVVTPAQPLMVIVPNGYSAEVEAVLETGTSASLSRASAPR